MARRTVASIPQFGLAGDGHEVRDRVAFEFGIGDLEVHRHHVCADSEEDALAEREHSASAPSQADADSDYGEAQEFGQQ